MIVYPMGLPPHEPIKQEMENTEDLSGTQVKLIQQIIKLYTLHNTLECKYTCVTLVLQFCDL